MSVTALDRLAMANENVTEEEWHNPVSENFHAKARADIRRVLAELPKVVSEEQLDMLLRYNDGMDRQSMLEALTFICTQLAGETT